MAISRSLLSAGVSTLLAALITTAGVAQDAECLRLEARLSEIEGRTNFGVGDFEKHESAVARQRMDLERATGQARAAGCLGGFMIFQSRRDPRCGRLMASIDRMRANLDRLTAARDQAGGFGFHGAERSAILRALAMRQCRPRYEQRAAGRSFFQTLFGAPRGWDEDYAPGYESYGTYRTLCVRTCDGYYFPISFSTDRSQFSRDEQTCRSLCPAAEVSLYVHRNPGEESEAMVSLAGDPYTALPNAFKYRKAYDKACTCGTPAVVAGTAGLRPPPDVTPVDPSLLPKPAPLPVRRPLAGEDPETILNRTAGFVPRAVELPEPPPTVVGGASASGKPVRIVGPSTIVTQ